MRLRRIHALARALVGACSALVFSAADAQPDPFAALLAHEVDPRTCAIGTLVPDLPLSGLDGRSTDLSDALRENRAFVLCLSSATCPLSSRLGPRITAIASEYQPRGVGFAIVNVSDTDTNPEMHQQKSEIRWPGAYLPDADRVLRRAINPRTTTEVLVIDSGRTLVYRGAIDDQFGVGSALAAPTRNFLRDALDALLESRPVRTPATWSPGCSVDPPKDPSADIPEAGNGPAAAVTYHGRISRIVRERCETCHFNGGPAPFSLETYRAVSGRSSMIAAVIRAGLMPPWDAKAPEHGAPSPWRHDPSLLEDERRDLLAWLEGPRPMGEPKDAPAPVQRRAGWMLGSPETVLLSPRVDLPPDGALVFSRLEIETMLKEAQWVASWEMMSRKRMTLHHAVLFLERERRPEGMSDDTALREGRLEPILIAGAAHSGAACPPGAARAVPAGARLIVHAWFRPVGTIMGERLRVAMRFLHETPTHIVRSVPAVADGQAGGGRVSAVAGLTDAGAIIAISPSIGLAASDVEVTVRPGASPGSVLFEGPRFRAAWPARYEPLEPRGVASGTMLDWSATPTEEPAAGGVVQGIPGFMGFVEVLFERE